VFADTLGAIVVKVNPTIVLIWGFSATAAEAAMQDFAHKILNHDIIQSTLGSSLRL
jgi:hypothetical protein